MVPYPYGNSDKARFKLLKMSFKLDFRFKLLNFGLKPFSRFKM